MNNNKNLYFIPIIARAFESEDTTKAFDDAFKEISELGKQAEYKEGFRQFKEFIKSAIKPSGEMSQQKIHQVRSAIESLIISLATDTFEGDEGQKEDLIAALKSHHEWSAEFERIRDEAQHFLAYESSIKVEILKGEQIIGSFPVPVSKTFLDSISPGSYAVRFSNGRVLWEGDIAREDVIWAFAYPEKDLPMAAATEPSENEPTKQISLLNGELVIEIFAGLETGQMRIESGN